MGIFVRPINGMGTSRDSTELHATFYFPCAGNAGLIRLNLYARVRFYRTFAHETAGAASTRHSLRPLLFWAKRFAKPGRNV